jgi:hypothetical protein
MRQDSQSKCRPSRYRPVQPARWRAAAKITAALISIANAAPTTLRVNCLRVICFAMTLSSAPEVIAAVAQWFPSVEVNVRHYPRGRYRRPWMTLNRNVSSRRAVEESAVILFDEGGAAFQALRFGRQTHRSQRRNAPHFGFGPSKMTLVHPYDSKFAVVLACTGTFW